MPDAKVPDQEPSVTLDSVAALYEPKDDAPRGEAKAGDDPGDGDAGAALAKGEGEPDDPEGEPEDGTPEGDEGASDDAMEDFDFGDKSFQDMTVNVIVDRETKAVLVSDLVRTYQIGGAGENRLREADELKDKAREEAKEQLETQTREVDEIKDQARKQLEIQSQQWNANVEAFNVLRDLAVEEQLLDLQKGSIEPLRVDDPAEFGARLSELNSASAALEKKKSVARENMTALVEKHQTEQQEQRAKTIAVEGAAMIEKRPELADKQAWKKWSTEILAYAKSEGFDEAEIRGIVSHKVLDQLDKARRWTEAQNKLSAGKQRRPVRKGLRSGVKPETTAKPKDAAEILYG